jgi:hypothetical protein
VTTQIHVSVQAAVAGPGDDDGLIYYLTHQMITWLGDLLAPTDAEPLILEDPLPLMREPIGRDVAIARQSGYHD